jgi:hypothetical protein
MTTLEQPPAQEQADASLFSDFDFYLFGQDKEYHNQPIKEDIS